MADTHIHVWHTEQQRGVWVRFNTTEGITRLNTPAAIKGQQRGRGFLQGPNSPASCSRTPCGSSVPRGPLGRWRCRRVARRGADRGTPSARVRPGPPRSGRRIPRGRQCHRCRGSGRTGGACTQGNSGGDLHQDGGPVLWIRSAGPESVATSPVCLGKASARTF